MPDRGMNKLSGQYVPADEMTENGIIIGVL